VVSRRGGREFAMQTLYASEIGGGTLEEAADTLTTSGETITRESRDYGLRLARTTHRRSEEIDGLISGISANWDLDRLAVLDRIILRLAIAELLTESDVPTKVCINEAVEIAKKFSTENSSRFVNGLLDAVAKKLSGITENPKPNEDSKNG